MTKTMELNPDFILAVSEIGVLVFDLRDKTISPVVPKPISLQTAQERVFAAILQGYSVHSEEHDNHTRIYIVNRAEMDRAKKEYGYAK